MNTITKDRKTDRVILLKAREGATSSTGIVDPRLFTGENKLHILMDAQSCLWSFKYEHGGVPPIFKDQSFTTFSRAFDFAKNYFEKRSIDIIGIVD